MLTFRKVEKIIVGQIDGTPFSVPNTETAIEVLTAFRDAEVPVLTEEVMAYVKVIKSGEIAGSNEYLTIKPTTGEYFLQFEGKRSKIAIPQVLVNFIEDSYDKDIDFTPVLKSWLRLLDNPRYSAQMAKYFSSYLATNYVDMDEVTRLMEEEDIDKDIAIRMCTYPDIAITQEGFLATYKVAEKVTWEYKMEWNEEKKEFVKVKKNILEPIAPIIDPITGKIDSTTLKKFKDPDFKEDFVFTPYISRNGDKFFSNNVLGYQYKVGEMQHLPKDAVRNLSNTFGGGGLYTGGLRYVENYGNKETETLTCLVNPSDILSFQSEGHAIRTDALFVNNIWGSNVALKGIYHSSDYGKLSEERLDEMLKDATSRGVNIAEEQANNGSKSKREYVEPDYDKKQYEEDEDDEDNDNY
jgi:hypothetical protein